MNWTEVTIDTAKAGLDVLCAMLTDIGFKGFLIHDPDDYEELLAGNRIYREVYDSQQSQN